MRIKNFHTSKDTSESMKRQARDFEKIITNHMSDKVCVSQKFK